MAVTGNRSVEILNETKLTDPHILNESSAHADDDWRIHMHLMNSFFHSIGLALPTPQERRANTKPVISAVKTNGFLCKK